MNPKRCGQIRVKQALERDEFGPREWTALVRCLARDEKWLDVASGFLVQVAQDASVQGQSDKPFPERYLQVRLFVLSASFRRSAEKAIPLRSHHIT